MVLGNMEPGLTVMKDGQLFTTSFHNGLLSMHRKGPHGWEPVEVTPELLDSEGWAYAGVYSEPLVHTDTEMKGTE